MSRKLVFDSLKHLRRMPDCLCVHALTSVSTSVEVRKQPDSSSSLPSTLFLLLFSPRLSPWALSSSSLTALSGWVLESAQFGDQSLPRSLLLRRPWLCGCVDVCVCVWVGEKMWESVCVCVCVCVCACVCVCHPATSPALSRLNRQSHYLLSVSVVPCQAPLHHLPVC